MVRLRKAMPEYAPCIGSFWESGCFYHVCSSNLGGELLLRKQLAHQIGHVMDVQLDRSYWQVVRRGAS